MVWLNHFEYFNSTVTERIIKIRWSHRRRIHWFWDKSTDHACNSWFLESYGMSKHKTKCCPFNELKYWIVTFWFYSEMEQIFQYFWIQRRSLMEVTAEPDQMKRCPGAKLRRTQHLLKYMPKLVWYFLCWSVKRLRNGIFRQKKKINRLSNVLVRNQFI